MTTLPITLRQAGFLNSLADAAKYYKQALNESKAVADRDLELLNSGRQPYGPNHQVLFEISKHYGELNALLKNIFMVFDPSGFEDDNARKEFVNNVNSWVEMAVTGPTGNDYSVYFQSESDTRFKK